MNQIKFRQNEIWLIAENATVINMGRISKFFISHPERQDTPGIYVKTIDEKTVIRLCSTVGHNEGMMGIQYIILIASLGSVNSIRCGTNKFWRAASRFFNSEEDEPFEERETVPKYRHSYNDPTAAGRDLMDPEPDYDGFGGEGVDMLDRLPGYGDSSGE